MSPSVTSDDHVGRKIPDSFSDDHIDGAFGTEALVPSSEPSKVVPMLVGATVEEVERELMLQTLARCDGNRTHAARVLGVSVRTMRNKIKQYSADGIEVPASG